MLKTLMCNDLSVLFVMKNIHISVEWVLQAGSSDAAALRRSMFCPAPRVAVASCTGTVPTPANPAPLESGNETSLSKCP